MRALVLSFLLVVSNLSHALWTTDDEGAAASRTNNEFGSGELRVMFNCSENYSEFPVLIEHRFLDVVEVLEAETDKNAIRRLANLYTYKDGEVRVSRRFLVDGVSYKNGSRHLGVVLDDKLIFSSRFPAGAELVNAIKSGNSVKVQYLRDGFLFMEQAFDLKYAGAHISANEC